MQRNSFLHISFADLQHALVTGWFISVPVKLHNPKPNLLFIALLAAFRFCIIYFLDWWAKVAQSILSFLSFQHIGPKKIQLRALGTNYAVKF